jgi:hypothetical protein
VPCPTNALDEVLPPALKADITRVARRHPDAAALLVVMVSQSSACMFTCSSIPAKGLGQNQHGGMHHGLVRAVQEGRL